MLRWLALLLCLNVAVTGLGRAATEIPAPVTPTASETSLASGHPRLSLGIGYPDLRLRGKLWRGLDGELKYAFDNVVQAYSGRLYATLWDWKALDFNLGGEAGLIRFNDGAGFEGSGSFYEPFVGIRWKVVPRISITAEFGPAFMTQSAVGQSVSSVETIVTTAIYFHLF